MPCAVQVYKAKLKTGEDVAIKVQRPGIEPIIKADLCIFRSLAYYINPISQRRLGTSAELIVDEFGEKMLEELDYNLEARSMEMFGLSCVTGQPPQGGGDRRLQKPLLAVGKAVTG